MEIKKVKLVCFSPTGTTRKVLESIAGGIGAEEVAAIDLTLPDAAQGAIPPFSDELVLLGAPVYGGRLPVDAISRFKKLRAKNSPAVCVVLYGNREFEDSLLELRDLAMELGFVPVAGAAFIGEHSFSTIDTPIASGRPDSLDAKKAREFGAGIKEKLLPLTSLDALTDLKIPGRYPYEGGPRSIAASPVTDEEKCTVCGMCAAVCPKAAIAINGKVITKTERCIRCCACIKNCPSEAKAWEDDMMKMIAAWLNENCGERKEPQVFGIVGE